MVSSEVSRVESIKCCLMRVRIILAIIRATTTFTLLKCKDLGMSRFFFCNLTNRGLENVEYFRGIASELRQVQILLEF